MAEAGPPAAVALEGIAKKFGVFIALRGVTLSVDPGEFVCFLGPSGCGKTTLLRIIAGLERQNAGAVMMAGRDVSGLPPSERNYGRHYSLNGGAPVSARRGKGCEGFLAGCQPPPTNPCRWDYRVEVWRCGSMEV